MQPAPQQVSPQQVSPQQVSPQQVPPQGQGNVQGRGTPPTTLQSLNPTRIVARRARNAMIIGALLLLSGLVMGGVGFLTLLLFGGFFGYIFIIVMLAMMAAGVYFFFRGLTYKVENPPALMVTDVLARELGGQYTFIRNISRPGLGYIDGILVGPPGALVFRIADKGGIYLNEGADWLERVGGKPFMLSRLNVTRECITDVYALRKYLAQKQLGNVPVYGLVVFVDPTVQLTARQPIVPIADLHSLMQAIRADFMRQEVRIDAQTVQRTVDTIYQG